MATYVFLNVPGYGHVNPTLAIVRELVARGEQVSYYLTEEFRAAIEETGATFHPYESTMGRWTVPTNFNPGASPTMMPMRMIDEGEHVLPQVFEKIKDEKPDFVIYDMMCIWAKIVAGALHIPAILLRPTYVFNERMNMGGGFRAAFTQNPELVEGVNQKFKRLFESYGVEPITMQGMFSNVEPLTLVFLPRAFQPGGDHFDERYVFVGPMIAPRPSDNTFPIERLTGQTVVYISLGTVFNNQADFFNMCIEAFRDTPWQIVLARGKNVDASALQDLPDNFIVAPYVPQLEVLPLTSVFVTHGGMNSTMESLYYGVPMVVVPQMMEQMMTARRVQDLELGLALEKEKLSVATIREAVERVMHEETYREHVRGMSKHVHEAGGYKHAVDAILAFAHKV